MLAFAGHGAGCTREHAVGSDASLPESGSFVAGGSVVEGSSADGGAVDYYVDVPSAAPYSLELRAESSTASLLVYSDPQRTILVASCTVSQARCVATLASGRYYVTVDPAANVSTAFRFALTPLVDEGTSAIPSVVDAVPSTRHTVSPGSTSYFAFDLPISGAYDLSFHGLDGDSSPEGLLLTTSNEPSFAGKSAWQCSEPLDDTSCRGSGFAAGTLYVRVESMGANPEPFTLAPVHTLGVGALTDAVPVGATPITSAVDGWSSSYFDFTTTEAGSYVVAIDTPAALSFAVQGFIDGNTSLPWPSCIGDVPCALFGLEPDTRYVVAVTPQANVDTQFQISITKGLAVGSFGAPVPIAADGIVSGRLDLGARSFYRLDVPADASYQVHLVALGDPQATIDVGIITAYLGSTPWGCWLSPSSTTDCSIGTVSSGSAIIAVDNVSGAAVDFTIAITPAP